MRTRTVLLIDDSAMLRRALARVLKGYGWDCVEARDPERAALLYRVADCVLSDWSMPNGGGARVLRESPVPVVIHTGSPDVNAPVVLIKPADPAAIDRELRAAIDARRDFARHLVTDLDRSVGRAAAAAYIAGLPIR